MIVKSYEIDKINSEIVSFYLLYGKNDGLKEELSKNILNTQKSSVTNYEEKDILNNPEIFIDSIFSGSLFENQKTIIIKRATDKILKIIEKIIEKEIKDVKIIIESDNLDKKSKLRSFFERNKLCICVALYPDNEQTLFRLISSFFHQKNIKISNQDISSIVNRSNGDRGVLKNELEKIEAFCLNKKKITSEEISQLINLTENHSILELIDNCLAKNSKKISKILNENNFSKEDSILITRTFLNKSKKILNLAYKFKENNNLELTISSARPPIFWKDKEITKKQLLEWTPNHMIKLIEDLSKVELQIKKNIDISLNIISDFILFQSNSKTNS